MTDRLRAAVDERLAPHLEVTGWSDGLLRIRLTRPALITQWRFQEPGVRRQLSRLPEFRDLREIRLVTVAATALRPRPPRTSPLPVARAPVAALQELARGEENERLRTALEALVRAAEAARREG